jgi:hypothetical protein
MERNLSLLCFENQESIMRQRTTYMIVSIAVVLVLIASACIEENVFINRTDEFPDTLRIGNGQAVLYKKTGAVIRYQETIEDSRCPSNIRCVWAGVARIDIDFYSPAKKKARFPLSIYGYVGLENSDAHKALDTLGYTFRLAALEPYPIDPIGNDYAKYIATIIIVKNESEYP